MPSYLNPSFAGKVAEGRIAAIEASAKSESKDIAHAEASRFRIWQPKSTRLQCRSHARCKEMQDRRLDVSACLAKQVVVGVTVKGRLGAFV